MKFIGFFIAMAFSLLAVGQTQTGPNGEYIDGEYVPTTIGVGITSTLSVLVVAPNYASAPGEVELFIDFPNNGAYIDITPAGGPTMESGSAEFSWQKIVDANGGSDSWLGTNVDPLPAFFGGGTYYFTVEGVITGVNPELTIVSAYFDLGNAEDAPGLIVSSTYPLDLLSFDGKMIECGKIELNWTAESEFNSDYIEVLRSTDGKKWVSAGMVGSQNLRSSTAIYSFTDTEGLDNYVRHYYYRLKQVDLNGNSTLHRIIGVKYDCIPANPEMKIFPNPASEKVKINITNISENRDIKAVIMNSNGHVVDDLMINSIHGAEVELKRFPSGVYKVQTLDLDEPVYQRFIHIK